MFALFLAIFSLDVLGEGYTFWETVVGLFMHNLPLLILIAILVISWNHELIGAITFIGLGIVGTIILLSKEISEVINPMLIILSIVCTSVGILFLLGWRQKRKLN